MRRPAQFRPVPPYLGGVHVTGITKDCNSVVVGSVTVKLFQTSNDLLISTTTSDAVTGAYDFPVQNNAATYYVVCYKTGVPDIAGTSVNTLTGVQP
jgi:hypothetical protein